VEKECLGVVYGRLRENGNIKRSAKPNVRDKHNKKKKKERDSNQDFARKENGPYRTQHIQDYGEICFSSGQSQK